MRTARLIITAALVAICVAACSGNATKKAKSSTTAEDGRLGIAYVSDGRVTVKRPGARDIVFANATIGQSMVDATTPAGLFWSSSGRYVTWSTSTPSLVAVADTTTGGVRTWPCPCTNGAFAGDRLIALDAGNRTVLTLPLGEHRFARARLRGPLAAVKVASLQIVAADAEGVVVRAEAGAKEWRIYKVSPDGASVQLAGGLPRRWAGAGAARADGTVAFAMSTNGGPCGLPDKLVIIPADGGETRELEFPSSPTRWAVRLPAWGTDGRLYVSLTKWPPCSGNPGAVTDRGEVWELDGETWRYTGLRMLGFQPIAADSYVGLRGEQRITTDSLDETAELVVAGKGGAVKVLARSVNHYAVSPRSLASFTGRSAALPASPGLPPAMRRPPVLGLSFAPNQEGFGQVRPGRVYLGGSPTGLVRDVRWHSWGGPTATADGTGIYAPGTVADGTPEPARVVASNLGYCRGTYAYRTLQWYFPNRGETLDPKTAMNICESS